MSRTEVCYLTGCIQVSIGAIVPKQTSEIDDGETEVFIRFGKGKGLDSGLGRKVNLNKIGQQVIKTIQNGNPLAKVGLGPNPSQIVFDQVRKLRL